MIISHPVEERHLLSGTEVVLREVKAEWQRPFRMTALTSLLGPAVTIWDRASHFFSFLFQLKETLLDFFQT